VAVLRKPDDGPKSEVSAIKGFIPFLRKDKLQ